LQGPSTGSTTQIKALEKELEGSMEAGGEQKLLELRQCTAEYAAVYEILHEIGFARRARTMPKADKIQTCEALQTE
jgi:hypothetical protein